MSLWNVWDPKLKELGLDPVRQKIFHDTITPEFDTTTTPSGGRHAFYNWPTDVPVPPGDELFGFTVRWPGRGYLVGPGSSIGGDSWRYGASSYDVKNVLITSIPGAQASTHGP